MKLINKKLSEVTIGEVIKLTIGATIASIGVAAFPFVALGVIGYANEKKHKKKH